MTKEQQQAVNILKEGLDTIVEALRPLIEAERESLLLIEAE